MNKDGCLFALLSGCFARHFLRINKGSLLSQEKLSVFSGNSEIQIYKWKLELKKKKNLCLLPWASEFFKELKFLKISIP